MSTTRRATVLGLIAVLAMAAQAQAAPRPGLVVWAGHLGSETVLHGVLLKANGTGSILAVSVANREKGTVTTVGPFKPGSAALSQIRAAATATLSAPRTAIAPSGPSGAYASATIVQGAKKHVVVGLNLAPPQLTALIVALNAALPPTAQLVNPSSVVAFLPPATPRSDPFAGKLIQHSQGTAQCPPGDAATSVSEPVSLKDAAADGLVTLTSKGGFGDDDVAVDAHWGPLPGKPPVVLRMNFEITPPPELSPADQARVVNGLKASVESRLGGLKASDGTPLTIQLNVRQRDPSLNPTPCFHEIRIHQDTNFDTTTAINTMVNMTGPFQPDPLPGYGDWSTLGTSWQTGGGFSDLAANVWTHEVLHFAGLNEAYHLAYQVGDVIKDFPQDARFQSQADVIAWAKTEEAFAGLDVTSGRSKLVSDPGHEHDFMGRCPDDPPCRVDQAAVDALVKAGQDNIEIIAAPGDLLLNKTADEQNLGVGTDFHLLVHRGVPAHVDGLVAYCIDAHRSIPVAGGRFDVLGRAADQGDPSLQPLQAVLEEIARRQQIPLTPTEGGQFAVWRVTDNDTIGAGVGVIDDILAAAHIVPGATYNATHFDDPNATAAETGSVSATAPLAPVVLAPAGPAPPAPKPALGAVKVAALSTRLLSLQATVSANDSATVTLQRATRGHGRKAGTTYHRIRTYKALALHLGANFLTLATPKLAAGRYRVVVAGSASSRTAALSIRR